MELDFSPEQLQIKDAVRRFLAKECAPALIRRMREEEAPLPRGIWRQMATLGWLGLPLKKSYGGTECDWVTLAAVCEELGRACDPTPFVDCVLTCGWLLQDIASEEQKQKWLPPLIGGDLRLSLATLEEQTTGPMVFGRTTLRDTGQSLRLNGRKLFVENAADCDFLMVTTVISESRQPCLVLVSPGTEGVELIRLRSMAHPNLYEARFHEAVIPQEQVIGRGVDVTAAVAVATERTVAFQSAAAAGGAKRVLEMAVAYARERVQFGKPIGSFQAVQHMLANAWSEVETAWLAAYEAVTYLEAGMTAATDKVAVAKCASNETFTRTCFAAHQVFGGMGYMWETDLHLWTRKAKEIEMAFGGIYPYRRRLAAGL